MEKAWYWKVLLVLGLVIGSVLYLLPTFLPNSLPGWYTDIFEKRVNLGLDLQGGIHLVLGVEVDKALEDKADQYVRDFKASMKEKRIAFKKVYRVPGGWDIQFELKDAQDRTRLEKRILDGYYNLDQVSLEGDDESIVRVTFDDEYVEELRRNARDQARVTVRNRVDEFGVAEPTIAPHGENGILVQLPGMFDPERAKGLLGRTAQLEFKMVDDESDFIRDLKGKLPEGIRMEYYTYEGPNEEPVTEAFLIAKGEGNEGRNRLLDFFNNASEIEQFLKEREVDPKLIAAIMAKVRGGLTPIERRDVLEMAAPALASDAPDKSSSAAKAPEDRPEGAKEAATATKPAGEGDDPAEKKADEAKADPSAAKAPEGGPVKAEPKPAAAAAEPAKAEPKPAAAAAEPAKAEPEPAAAAAEPAKAEPKQAAAAAEPAKADPKPAAAAAEPAKAEPEPAAAAAEPAKAEPKQAAAAAEPRKVHHSSKDLLRLEKLLQGKVPEGHEIGFERKERQLESEFRTYLLFSEVSMTGDYITDARVSNDPETGTPEVSLNFDRTGATIFEKLTGENVKKRMAIVLEGEVASAPVIQTRIAGGRARITLGASQNYNEALGEARDLAVVLRAGALPAPVKILEERTVGPSMGEDARKQGTWALVLGMGLVILFMVIYYKLSGLVADLALILNALFIMAVMAAFQATLTLPGIAGIILTIGMAVDANVIINERIREEIHTGKTARAAVDAGYGRAFWTIFDANFTTLIAAVVLWSYGSGPIQGFAVTLFIGILASMFTAIFVTRLVIDWLVLRKKVERLSI